MKSNTKPNVRLKKPQKVITKKSYRRLKREPRPTFANEFILINILFVGVLAGAAVLFLIKLFF